MGYTCEEIISTKGQDNGVYNPPQANDRGPKIRKMACFSLYWIKMSVGYAAHCLMGTNQPTPTQWEMTRLSAFGKQSARVPFL